MLQEIEKEEMLPNLCYEVSITVIPNRDKYFTRNEHYRSISLMNINANFLNKNFSKQIITMYKKIIYYIQVGFVLGIKGNFKI